LGSLLDDTGGAAVIALAQEAASDIVHAFGA
jgi:hypothetical protein